MLALRTLNAKAMNEENTKDLTQEEKLDLILAELRTLHTRVAVVAARPAQLEAKEEIKC